MSFQKIFAFFCYTLSAMLTVPTFADTWTSNTGKISTSSTGTKVAIGLTGNANIRSKLDVEGNAIVGAGYSGNSTVNPPSNGLLVEGSVGIGTSTIMSGRKLEVNGTIRGTSIEGNSVFPVTAFGAVVNDASAAAQATNQSAFENALSAAAAVGGGIVYVPSGQFHLNGSLNIPSSVRLQGTWETAHDGGCQVIHNFCPAIRGGSVLMAYAGRTQENGTAFITLNDDASLRGISIYYPQQNNPNAIAVYPWTIRGLGDVDIENVTLINSYQGIDMRGFPWWNANSHLVRNVNMTALRFGLFVDRSTDVGRLENVHIHPKYWVGAQGWSMSDSVEIAPEFGAIRNYTLANLWGFRFQKADGELVQGCMVIWAYVGYSFMGSEGFVGSKKKYPEDLYLAPWVALINSFADLCENSVDIQASIIGHGLKFTNCNLSGRFSIGAGNMGPILISNSLITDATGNQTSHLVKMGQGPLIISNSTFLRSFSAHNHPFVHVMSGPAVLSNNYFGFFLPANVTYNVLKVDQAGTLAECQSIWMSPLIGVTGNGTHTSCASRVQ